jgi:hypothetical protein
VFAERLIVLKSCYFLGQSIPVSFIIHSFSYSPSVNGFDFYAIICEIGKLA